MVLVSKTNAMALLINDRAHSDWAGKRKVATKMANFLCLRKWEELDWELIVQPGGHTHTWRRHNDGGR